MLHFRDTSPQPAQGKYEMNEFNISVFLLYFPLLIIINIPIYFFFYSVFNSLSDESDLPRIFKFSTKFLIYILLPLFYSIGVSLGWVKILAVENFNELQVEKKLSIFFAIGIAVCIVSLARISCSQKQTVIKDFLFIQVIFIVISIIFLHMIGFIDSKEWRLVADNMFKIQEGNAPFYALLAGISGLLITEVYILLGRKFGALNNNNNT